MLLERSPAILPGRREGARLHRYHPGELPRARRRRHREVRVRRLPRHPARRSAAGAGCRVAPDHWNGDADLRRGDGPRGLPPPLQDHARDGCGVVLRSRPPRRNPQELRNEVWLGRVEREPRSEERRVGKEGRWWWWAW